MPGFVLTSMVKRVDNAVYDVVKEVLDGKFEGGLIVDEHVYSISLNGCGETVGSEFRGESYTSLEGPFSPCDDCDPLTPDEISFLASRAGAILYESSDGFVEVSYYEDEEAFLVAWNRVVDSYDDETSEDDDTPEGWGEID